MAVESDPGIRLRLLRLALLHAGEVPLKDVTPKITRPVRESLEARGLIERECFVTPGDGRRVRCLKLTDRGWHWLCENFAGDVARSAQCGRELTAILQMVRGMLRDRGLTFSEFVAGHSPPASTPGLIGAADAGRLITRACERLQSAAGSPRLRIADVRAELPLIPRAVFDEAIQALEAAGDVALYRIDNPMDLQPADREAELRTATGQPRHLAYLKKGST